MTQLAVAFRCQAAKWTLMIQEKIICGMWHGASPSILGVWIERVRKKPSKGHCPKHSCVAIFQTYRTLSMVLFYPVQSLLHLVTEKLKYQTKMINSPCSGYSSEFPQLGLWQWGMWIFNKMFIIHINLSVLLFPLECIFY